MRLETSIADCVLRPWQSADVADLVANANNRKVWRNLTELFPHPYTERDAEQRVEIATDSGRSVHLAITLAGEAVGGVGAIAGQGIAESPASMRVLEKVGFHREGILRKSVSKDGLGLISFWPKRVLPRCAA